MKLRKYLIAFTILFVVFASKCGKNATIPDELVGIWKTPTFKYRDTFFELRKKVVIFRTKEGDVNSYTITKMKREKNRNDEWILYTIYYQNNNLKTEFPFYYHPSQNGLIRFKNQLNLAWKKAER